MLEFHCLVLSTPKTKELHFQWRWYLTIAILFVAPVWRTVIEFTHFHFCRSTTMLRLLVDRTVNGNGSNKKQRPTEWRRQRRSQ